MTLRMKLRQEELTVSRLEPGAAIPDWATTGSLWNIAQTGTELSIVSAAAATPADVRAERGWRVLELEGPIPFGLTGILSSVLSPLAAAQIGIFAFSTFDTDFILVRNEDIEEALAALRQAGHVIL